MKVFQSLGHGKVDVAHNCGDLSCRDFIGKLAYDRVFNGGVNGFSLIGHNQVAWFKS